MTMAAVIAGWLALHGCATPCQAGILANIEAESGLDPCAVSASGVGLVQYAGNRRRQLLATLTRDWCDPRRQVEYIIADIAALGLRDRLFSAADPAAAAVLFAREFERPANRDYRHRAARARELYQWLSSSTAMAVTP